MSWAGLQLMNRVSTSGIGISDRLQGVDAALNEIVVLAVVIVFLTSLETRLKCRRVLEMLHKLRCFAHVVDMHQLTKDPDAILHPGQETASSPKRALTQYQLIRYLDYCSELLALVSKMAALHGQNMQDGMVLTTENERQIQLGANVGSVVGAL